MKITTLFIALTAPAATLLAQSAPTTLQMPSLPPQTAVDIAYSTQPSKEQQNTGSATQRLTVLLYKGATSRILVRTFSNGQTAYVVRVNGWQFYTDPTAPLLYKDFVKAVSLERDGREMPDFPELEFLKTKVAITQASLNGTSALLVTAEPPKPKFTDAFIANQIKSVGNPAERAELEKGFREDQASEMKRGSQPPDRAWLDEKTNLPLRVEAQGVAITYTYRSKSSVPSLPSSMTEAIKAKFGTMPPL